MSVMSYDFTSLSPPKDPLIPICKEFSRTKFILFYIFQNHLLRAPSLWSATE